MEKKIFSCLCLTDIHNQQAMLDMPTTLRESLVYACENGVNEFGKFNLAINAGDNISDYPYWNRSCALPKKNFLSIKKQLVDCIAKTAKGNRVLYVAGNNDMILGDIGTKENLPYNTTEFYWTGPMNKTLGELKKNEVLFTTAKEKPHERPYLSAFHYVVDGIDFLGINIDPDTAFNSHEGYYSEESIIWLKNKLNEIDVEGNKLIFVVGHLSVVCYKNGKLTQENMPYREEFLNALKGHKNLFYLYGHIHGEEAVYKDYTSGAVLHIGSDNLPLSQNLNNTVSPSENYDTNLVHIGGLRPFRNFENDGLTGYGGGSEKKYFPCTGTCKLAQYMVFEVYNDKVVFYLRNTGNIEGYTRKDLLKPYTVNLRK